MKMTLITPTRYLIRSTKKFNNSLKKIYKQGKDISKLEEVVEILANGEPLEIRNKNHNLINDKNFKYCKECHIEPDWILIYQHKDEDLILLLLDTGSHSDLFRNGR